MIASSIRAASIVAIMSAVAVPSNESSPEQPKASHTPLTSFAQAEQVCQHIEQSR